MRPVRVALSVVGHSPWIPLDRQQGTFGAAIAVLFSNGASGVAAVEHTFDAVNNSAGVNVAITRSGAVATVVWPSHGLLVGDSINIIQTGSTNLDVTYGDVASVVNDNTFTYTVANTGVTVAAGMAQAFRVFAHETLVGLTARADGNYAFPPQAVRLSTSVLSAGTVEMIVVQNGP